MAAGGCVTGVEAEVTSRDADEYFGTKRRWTIASGQVQERPSKRARCLDSGSGFLAQTWDESEVGGASVSHDQSRQRKVRMRVVTAESLSATKKRFHRKVGEKIKVLGGRGKVRVKIKIMRASQPAPRKRARASLSNDAASSGYDGGGLAAECAGLINDEFAGTVASANVSHPSAESTASNHGSDDVMLLCRISRLRRPIRPSMRCA